MSIPSKKEHRMKLHGLIQESISCLSARDQANMDLGEIRSHAKEVLGVASADFNALVQTAYDVQKAEEKIEALETAKAELEILANAQNEPDEVEDMEEVLEDQVLYDPLYERAKKFVIKSRKASVSSVQREIRIGYNRAALIVEQLEKEGIVSELGHNMGREVLVSPSAA